MHRRVLSGKTKNTSYLFPHTVLFFEAPFIVGNTVKFIGITVL